MSESGLTAQGKKLVSKVGPVLSYLTNHTQCYFYSILDYKPIFVQVVQLRNYSPLKGPSRPAVRATKLRPVSLTFQRSCVFLHMDLRPFLDLRLERYLRCSHTASATRSSAFSPHGIILALSIAVAMSLRSGLAVDGDVENAAFL